MLRFEYLCSIANCPMTKTFSEEIAEYFQLGNKKSVVLEEHRSFKCLDANLCCKMTY